LGIDFTGIIGAGVVAVMGMGILPYKRSAIKKLMRKRISEVQEKLNSALENHFTRYEREVKERKRRGKVDCDRLGIFPYKKSAIKQFTRRGYILG
jgi:hypothetical protein